MSRVSTQPLSVAPLLGAATVQRALCHWLARDFPGLMCSYLLARVRCISPYGMLRRERANFVLGTGRATA